MGGEGYALGRAGVSDSALVGVAQVRSRANRARSEMPRRWPNEVDDVSQSLLMACMDVVMQLHWAPGSRAPHVFVQTTPRFPECCERPELSRGRYRCVVCCCRYSEACRRAFLRAPGPNDKPLLFFKSC